MQKLFRSIKKFSSGIVCMLGVLILCPIMAVNAAGMVTVTLELPEENLKIRSNIPIIVELTSDEDIGMVVGNIRYDSSTLTLKSMTIAQGTATDQLQYSEKDGKIAFIYMNKKEQSFHKQFNLDFSQSGEGTGAYQFSAEITEALDKSSEEINVSGHPEGTVRIEESVAESSQKAVKKSSSSVTITADDLSENATPEQITEYSVVFEEPKDESFTVKLTIAGIAAAAAVITGAVLVLLRHIAKTNSGIKK